MPGPAPNPNARRPRNGSGSGLPAFTQFVTLPARRKGRRPPFPLDNPTDHEIAVWRDLWTMPQAVMWDQYGWHRTVARYVRVLEAAEQPAARATDLAAALKLEDALGLTPKSMLALRWRIADDEIGARRDEPARPRRHRDLKAVDL